MLQLPPDRGVTKVSTKKAGAYVPFKPAPDGKFYCPECKAGPYQNPRGLSSHRRSAHGIKGESKGAVIARTQKDEPTTKAAKDAAALRREERDYKREYRLRKRREAEGLPTLPAPEPIAEHEPQQATHLATTKENAQDASKLGKKRGPYKSRKTNAASRKEKSHTREIEVHITSDKAAQEYYDHRNPPRIPEATLAVAYGRFLEFSASMAREYDLPSRQFASELTALIRRSS
jgi:hypothetical protein